VPVVGPGLKVRMRDKLSAADFGVDSTFYEPFEPR
jgi:hypothetical protein